MVSYREGPNTGLTRRWLALWTTKQKTTGLSDPLTQTTLVNVSGIFREQNQTVEERLRKSAEMEKSKLQDEGHNCRKDLSISNSKWQTVKGTQEVWAQWQLHPSEGWRLAPSHLGAEGKLNSWDHRAISFHKSQLPGSIQALSWAKGVRGLHPQTRCPSMHMLKGHTDTQNHSPRTRMIQGYWWRWKEGFCLFLRRFPSNPAAWSIAWLLYHGYFYYLRFLSLKKWLNL